MSFINPQLLWFATLVSVPIIIYLINRQRYRRRRWAAMEFLLRAMKKNQRRLQLQNLLLLLVRLMIILLLVAAAARPVLRRSPLGIASGTQQNWILVIDTSYSMGYREGPASLFEQAGETLTEMVGSLLKEGDKVALTTLAHDPRVLVHKSEVKEKSVGSSEVRQRLVREIRGLTLSARGVRLAPSLRLLDEVTREFVGPAGEQEPFRIIFFSDLQRRDWLIEDGPRSPEVAEIIRGIRERGGQFSVAKLSAETRKLNVAVTDVSVKPELVSREVPVEIRVTVRNLSDQVAENLDLSVRVRSAREIDPAADDDAEAQLGEVLRIGGGDSATRRLAYRFDSPGFQTVTAEVRSDGLVLDNRRFLVVPVQEDVGVLVVDGDPAIQAEERETFYLEYALQPKDDDLGAFGGRFTPFLPDSVTADQLGDLDWKRYSVVILANVADVSDPVIKALEAYAEKGGALMVFLGENVSPAYYNEHFFRDGKGLLPLEIIGKRGDRQAPVTVQFSDPNHPIARYFEDHKDASYLHGAFVSFFHYFQFAEPERSASVKVLCRFNDMAASPAIFDSAYGRGRVMWFASTADEDWNHLPLWHDYVVFLYESISYLMGFGMKSLNLEVGEPFLRMYDSRDYASEVLLRVPGSEVAHLGSPRELRRGMRDVDASSYVITYDDTSVPGLYRLDLKRPNSEQGDSVEYFAVNVDTAEGDLRGMTATDFVEHFGIDPDSFDASKRFHEKAKEQDLMRGREYWTWFLVAVLLLLLLETLLAQRFGRRAG